MHQIVNAELFRTRAMWITISQSANETHKVRDQTLHQTKLGGWRSLPSLLPTNKNDLHC